LSPGLQFSKNAGIIFVKYLENRCNIFIIFVNLPRKLTNYIGISTPYSYDHFNSKNTILFRIFAK